jgi:hypothetical protein
MKSRRRSGSAASSNGGSGGTEGPLANPSYRDVGRGRPHRDTRAATSIGQGEDVILRLLPPKDEPQLKRRLAAFRRSNTRPIVLEQKPSYRGR